MDSQVLDLLDETSKIEDEKKVAAKAMNELAKDAAKTLNGDASVIKKCKDYSYYHGKGWVNGDPLNLDPDEKFKDRISPIMKKLRDIIVDLQANGMTELLTPYFSALEGYGIHVTLDEEVPTISDVNELKTVITSMCGYQQVICENSEIIKEEHSKKSEELNFTPASKYKEVFGLYSRKMKGKDIDDSIQDKVTFCEMYETALNEVQDMES